VEDLLERAGKAAEGAEVFLVSSRRTQAVFEANRLKQVQTKESAGTALRLIREGRIGFAAATGTGGEERLLEMALEMAPFGAEARFEFPGSHRYPEVTVFDPEIDRVSEEDMVRLGQSLIERIRAVSGDIVCEVAVSRSCSSIEIRNTSGGEASYQKSVSSISVEGVLVRDTDMLFVGDLESSCHPIVSADAVAHSTLEQLERAEKTVPAPSGSLPVVFTPHGVASALLSPLIVALNGKTVLRGASPLGQRRGERVLAENFSLWDDPVIDFCPAGYICDDEGVPGRRKALIREGMVEGFLYDLQTAGEAGTESTGNAGRSLTSLPAPTPSALIIEGGETGFDDLLAEIRDGLVVEQLMGATQGNILGGDFSGNVLLGYRVENGRIVGRVKDTMVSGNVYQILKEGIIMGSDSRWLGGSLQTPSIYCPSVAVAVKG